MPSPAERDDVVILERASKIYRMGEVDIPALRNVDLRIPRGEFVAVVGPSGSGKTTLLNLLGGLDTPTHGTIVVDGVDLTGFSERQLTLFRREKIGFVFQFFNLIPTLTAEENVQFAIELASRDGVPPDTNPAHLLAKVGLGERLHHFPSQLSGGEQQRVAVARALAKDPVLVLGDEPTGNLDFRTGKLVLGAMKEMNREGKTVILVTHNTPLARVADRILHIRDGQIVEQEIVENPIEPDDIVW
ncbi:MAG: macrolide ABC transporter ATP-binding protein [Actinobacteria bacterium HGW-Actinobacteria-1]|jgi:putative ABC transport system ATP-binding protein|nr:MAG: macrolide ABC transporter ATP-binding protein [Actinobacteria bacterium HGW-Actinobacteria-1]